MKKNTMMRIASAMLVLALLTTCVISGTFAKYITTADASDRARVAKWGVAFTLPAGSAFDTSYDALVVSSNTEKVVAPGTSNSTGTVFSMSGKPEVKFTVSFALTVAEGGDVVLPAGSYSDPTTAAPSDTFTLTDPYYPVKFSLVGKLNGQEINIENKTLTQMKTEIATATTKTYDANTELTAANNSLTLTWAWDKEVDNRADTVLGNIAAGITTAPAGASTNLNFTITMTATQVVD